MEIRAYRLALSVCCLFVFLTAGPMLAQTTSMPAGSSMDGDPTANTSGTFDTQQTQGVQNPATTNQRQGITDISPPRRQDRTSDRDTNRSQDGDRDQNQNQDRNLNQNRNQNPNQLKNGSTIAQPPQLTEFQQIVAAGTGHTLPLYGATLFNTIPSTFAPVDNIPVTPDYVIGPGDELRLQIWGQINQQGSFIVDRTGSISLRDVGTVHVAGLQFSQLADFLKSQLNRVYRNFDLNVNLGQLRSIQVFVVGQAKKPGSFTIGSLSTLMNALFASGGPLPQGSLRDIQVKRGNETITHFDLYDLLLHGDKSKDVRLASGDVIFIPDVGPQVAVLGSVTTQAIFELHGEKSFQQILALAGGQTNVASGSKVRVERIYKHTQRSMIDVDLADADSPPVQDGDIVMVSSILDRFKDAVTLRGNVANPGRYAWHQGMRISDLIPSREMLVTRNYYQRQNQLAQSNADYLGPRQEGALGIQSGPVADAAATRTATTTNGGGTSAGAALTAGNENFAARNDVILSAPDIDWDYAVIERQSTADLTTSLVPFNLGKVIMDKDSSQDLVLLPGDVVTIFSKADIRVPTSRQTKFVKLEGEFVASGVYSVHPGESLHQLLTRVGGLTPDADLFASEFTRESVRRLQRQRLLEYADSLESEITARTSASATSALTDRDAAAAQASAEEARTALTRLRQAQPTGRIVLQLKPDSNGIASIPDMELEDGDRFVVPKTPSSVSVVGQVYSANAFVFGPGKRVRDYLRLAGGPDRIADEKREFILRADGSVLSRQYATGRKYGGFDRVMILPGDTVIVPPKIEKGAIWRNLLNISTILQGFGIGAAAIQVLK